MTESIAAVIVTAMGVFVARSVWRIHQSGAHAQQWLILRAIRWWHCLIVLATIVVTVAVAYVLMQVPGLAWGWWSAVGGRGNVLLGQTQDTGHGGGLHAYLTVAAFIVPALLILQVPLAAHGEEQSFRRGSEDHGPVRVAVTSVAFGLIHLIVGIPIAAALALAIPGVVYHLVYRRAYHRLPAPTSAVRLPSCAGPDEFANAIRAATTVYVSERDVNRDAATLEAAAVHTLFNLVIVTVLFVALTAPLVVP